MLNNGIGSWPARRARSSRDDAAIVFEHQTWSFGQILDRSTRLAHALRGMGVAHGDRVAYLGPNHPSYVETLFACGMLGAILVPLNTRLAPPEYQFILGDAKASVLIWSPESAQIVDALANMRLVEHLVTLGSATDRAAGYESLLADASSDLIDQAVSLDDLCMIQYTSGTSGQPKGVMLSHGNVTWNCINQLVHVDIGSDEVNLVVAPMFHTAGMNNSFLTPFMKGAKAVLMAAWNPEQALDIIEKYRVTCMVAVPTMYQTMAASPRWPQADLSSIRILLCGGAPLPTALIELYGDRGLRIMQGYGLTETSPNATWLRADAAISKAGSAGTACFFSDLRIVSWDGADLPSGKRGEVLAQGPNVTQGYWKRPEVTQASFVDGDWLRTGDAARFDEDGYVYIVDRIKDMFISGGENVYPAEVENVIYRHPDVRECAVIGVPDERWGEVGRAIVVLAEGREVSEQALHDFVKGQLAGYKAPKSFVIVKQLPRTASGKLLKHRLREEFGQPNVSIPSKS